MKQEQLLQKLKETKEELFAEENAVFFFPEKVANLQIKIETIKDQIDRLNYSNFDGFGSVE